MANISKPTLLIDGDLVLHRSAVLAQEDICMDEETEMWGTHCDHRAAKGTFCNMIRSYRKKLGGGKLVVVMSDTENYRKDVMPDYKSNRRGMRKPPGWKMLRKWVFSPTNKDRWQVISKPRLEADDIIGILLTKPRKASQPEVIAVTDDKDFLQLPGKVFRIGMGDREAELHEVTPEEADIFFYTQCIAGDMTDGYPGCPGWGFDRANRLIRTGMGVEQYEHTLMRGKRKGETEMRQREVPMDDPWDIVVSCYVAAGLTEEDALLTARMARILRHTDYDFKRKEPILWLPSSST